jgi:hypothetical protein
MDSSAATADRPSSVPRRWWRQFSLRTLLLAMLVLSVCFALFAWRLQRARQQAAAVATIRKLGGNVDYDYRYKRGKMGYLEDVKGAQSSIPTFLLRWPGEDFFHEVVAAGTRDTQPQTRGDVTTFWQAIRELPKIEKLDTSGNWIDGKTTTEALRSHQRMKELRLEYGNLRDEDRLRSQG